jgi:hypothetical protein
MEQELKVIDSVIRSKLGMKSEYYKIWKQMMAKELESKKPVKKSKKEE